VKWRNIVRVKVKEVVGFALNNGKCIILKWLLQIS